MKVQWCIELAANLPVVHPAHDQRQIITKPSHASWPVDEIKKITEVRSGVIRPHNINSLGNLGYDRSAVCGSSWRTDTSRARLLESYVIRWNRLAVKSLGL